MHATIKRAGIVTVTTPEGETATLFADRGTEVKSLRIQADTFRERAARLMEKAALYDNAADRLE